MTAWRRPTANQAAALRAITDGRPIAPAMAASLAAHGWIEDGSQAAITTSYGARILKQSEAIARLKDIPHKDRPDIRLRKRMYGRSWLGWEVICHAGCIGGYYGTRNCVWATNDHAARDKWDAEAAYAQHVIDHLDAKASTEPVSASLEGN